jgi:hypothetical protein
MPYRAVLRSAPGHDILAYEGVVRAGYEISTPKVRIRAGARWRTSPLFGCYFFARVIDQWRALERTIGVLRVVKAAGVPARCPDEEIATLIARSDADGVIRLSSCLTSQSVVRRAFEPGGESADRRRPVSRFQRAAHGNVVDARSRDGPDRHPRRASSGRGLRCPGRAAERAGALMNRGELAALQDAIATILEWPPTVLDEVARWLAAASKPNGHDHTPTAAPMPRPAASKPHTAKRHDNPAHARAAEHRLLATMRERPGLRSRGWRRSSALAGRHAGKGCAGSPRRN